MCALQRAGDASQVLTRARATGTEYDVTQVTFEAMELFEDEDSESRHIPNALGMLNTNALTLVLTRIQRKVGFACTGFEYTGNPSTNSQKYSI